MIPRLREIILESRNLRPTLQSNSVGSLLSCIHRGYRTTDGHDVEVAALKREADCALLENIITQSSRICQGCPFRSLRLIFPQLPQGASKSIESPPGIVRSKGKKLESL